ncbi:MAG: hypothetical protein QXN66_05975 [Thermoplasmatales archaeon]
MSNILSAKVQDMVLKGEKDVSSGSLINLVTLLDLSIIVPSVAIFVAYNIKTMAGLSFIENIFILLFVLYLPLAILFAGRILGKNVAKMQDQNGEIMGIVLFFVLSFSLFGVYMPSIQKLASTIPSFQMLNLVGSVVVFLNLFLLLRNSGRIFR